MGLSGLASLDASEIKAEITAAKNMPKDSATEKALRKAAIEIARVKLDSVKAIKKYYKNTADLVQPDYALIDFLMSLIESLMLLISASIASILS